MHKLQTERKVKTMLYRGYVETKNKKCIEKFKDRTDFKTLEQVKNLPEYAGILAEDTMFIDIDDVEQSELMMNIVEGLQLNCKVIQTSRGKHFIFKNSQVHGCRTHCTLAVGLTADIKVGFKASYEVLKVGGEERFVEWDIEEGKEYQEVPKMFYPIRCNMDFINMDAGDGRNQALFNYILTLTANDFTQEETRETIRLINQYILKDPLSEDEIETILRDDAFKKPVFFNGAQFLFDKFATYIKNACHVVVINGNLHIYKDGIYQDGYRAIEAAMIQHIPNLSDAKRKEVIKYLYLICEELEPADERYIAFRNGIFDLIEGEMLDFTPDIPITNIIPWDFNPAASSELVEQMLNKISCGDMAIRALLEECIGYCFYRSNKYQKAFVLTGGGSNGKSVFLTFVNNILGNKNISALDLSELGDRFNVSMMYSKLANVGDDIGDDFLQGSQISIFKKVVTGNRIKAERKQETPFEFNPYIKLLFSANNIPRMKDRTGAVLRRLVIIPFNAVFDKTDADYNPNIDTDLKKQESIEYMILLGIQGLQRILINNGFTESDKVQKEIDEYEEFNNPVLGFVREMEEEHGKGYLLRETASDIYAAYQLYCDVSRLQAESKTSFGKTLRSLFNVETVPRKIKGKSIRFYRMCV